MLVRPRITDGGMTREVLPGDVIAGGENILAGSLTTVGAGTWTAAMIATGIIRRTGPVGGYTDTTDTASNIIKALAGNIGANYQGNNPSPDVVPGSTFRMLFINTVAQALTWAAGEGVEAGTGTLTVAASLVREYLITVKNSTPRQALGCTNGAATPTVTFDTPQDMGTITPGMMVIGTNITAGSKVAGVTLNGSGKISGVTLDQNVAGANATLVSLVFSPVVMFDGLRSSTL